MSLSGKQVSFRVAAEKLKRDYIEGICELTFSQSEGHATSHPQSTWQHAMVSMVSNQGFETKLRSFRYVAQTSGISQYLESQKKLGRQ